ncbi:hypothetical protein FOA43_004654 [Brettanomyces nanus]|uniref:2-dehydropantolactone reductase n=1 Tax=Eeniella nana TaxID=13502 RepID=A0A875RYA8_EENNA|nr:uncharacterized protein FOA43_004654 [Brettanomyces nanus]QPG77247.1 hypothetical protein FOA43_004654 [Brettanomyces nanus]
MVTPKSSIKTLKLNTGALIPQVGLGTWRSSEEEGYNAVLAALKDGYRHIDTARCYGNEEPVGRAINDFMKQSGVQRSDLFVTTKLWCTEFKDPKAALERSLKRLHLDYVDLLLMHWPLAMKSGEGLFPRNADGSRKLLPFEEWSYIDTYKAMQPLIDLNLAKAIGISNYNIPKIQALLADKGVTVKPACLQVELHPYLPQQELVDFCKAHDIVVEAYSPLGSSGAPLLKEKVINEIGEKYGVSAATVIISWAVARGTVVLPKSINPVRVSSNRKIIPLSEADMDAINGIQKTTSRRFVCPDWGIDIFNSDGHFKPMN